MKEKTARNSGFTLLELTIVISLILIIATLVVPTYQTVLKYSKETTLKDTLFKLRDAIDKYTLDKEEAPQSLEALVEANYIRAVPIDPLTGSNQTWEVELEDEPISRKGTRGIKNIYSGAEGSSGSGASYRDF